MVATSNALAQTYVETINNLQYLIDADAKTATVTASGEGIYSGFIDVPEKVKAGNGVEYPVTALGDRAFKKCVNLVSITIPISVTSLGESCFSGCYNLTSISYLSSVTYLGDSCFFQCNNLPDITIPSVSFIGNCCFYGCASLTSISIPYSVFALGDDAFHGCASLTSISIPSSVTSIGRECFADCDKLTSITIPSSVKSFGDGCFQRCSSLTSITIPSSVTDLGLDSFYGCTNLESVIFEGKCPENSIRYSDIPTTCILYVPKEYLQDYKDALGDIYPYIYAYSSTNINQAKMRGIVATSHDGIVTLSGLDNGEEVRFYTADGKQIGTTKAIDGVASQAVSSTSLIIAKIGRQAIKIAVK